EGDDAPRDWSIFGWSQRRVDHPPRQRYGLAPARARAPGDRGRRRRGLVDEWHHCRHDALRNQSIEVPFDTPIGVGAYRLRFRPSDPPRELTPSRAPAAAPAPVPLTDDEHEARADLRREIHRQLLEHLDLAQMDATKIDDASFRPRVLVALRRIVKNLEARIGTDTDK